jgi:hypothetical protein
METRNRKKQRVAGRLTDLGPDVLATIAAFTELADVPGVALTSLLFARAIKDAGTSLWPTLAAKYTPAVVPLHAMLPSPKPPFLVLFQRHLRAKISTAPPPKPHLVPATSRADDYFSYEISVELEDERLAAAGKSTVVWAGTLAHSVMLLYASDEYITLPLDSSIGERIFKEDNIEALVSSIHLTVYKTKRSTSETQKIYDGVPCDGGDNHLSFQKFHFAESLNEGFRNIGDRMSSQAGMFKDSPQVFSLRVGIPAWEEEDY